MKKTVRNLPLAKILGVNPRKAINFLLVPLGTKVDEGDLIAQRLGLGGIKKKKVTSPVSGRLVSLKEETGELEIETQEKKDEETPQEEENQEKEQNKIEEKTTDEEGKKLASGIFGFGKAEGEGLFLKTNKIGIDDLNEKVKEKIVFCKEIKSKGVIFKLAAFDALGLVLGKMSEEEEQELIEEVKGKVSLAVLVLEDDDVLKKVEKKKGKFLVDGEEKKLCYID